MKIAVWYNLPSGGAKRALYEHVRGLVARGHHVEAWCPPMADRAFLPLSDMIEEHVVDLDRHNPLRWTDEVQLTLRSERSIKALQDHCRTCASDMERRGFDILFANSCELSAASPIGRFTSLPAILYLQEPFRSLYEAQPRLCWLARPDRKTSLFDIKAHRAAFADLRQIRNWRLQAREEVDNAAAYRRILVNSYFSRESVLRAYGLDSDVCYLGIDMDLFTDRGLPREDFIVGLSSIVPPKNIAFCIRAIAALPAPRPRLVWIANSAKPDLLAELQSLANALGVDFVPKIRIPDAELVDTLNRATAMVYAPRLEPFGLSPLEANACGVPVVAVAEGGVRETIIEGENGLLVESDPQAMAAALQRLRATPDLARHMGRNARRFVEQRWSQHDACDRLETHLLKHAGQPSGN